MLFGAQEGGFHIPSESLSGKVPQESIPQGWVVILKN
jgi:hypothetical protein